MRDAIGRSLLRFREGVLQHEGGHNSPQYDPMRTPAALPSGLAAPLTACFGCRSQVKSDILDWHGDHPHTNFHTMFDALVDAGFFLEVLGSPLTCFDAMQVCALSVVRDRAGRIECLG